MSLPIPAFVDTTNSDLPGWLPALRTCMSPDKMRKVLNENWRYTRNRALTVTDCQLVRVYPRRAGEFLLEYQVRLADHCGEQTQTVLGELVGVEAEQRCRTTIRRLSKPKRAQLDPDDAANLVSCIPDLGLVLRLPGLDERIEGLKLVHQPAVAASILADATGNDVTRLRHVEAQLLGHRLGKRCIARFRYQVRDPETGVDQAQSLIVKLYKMHTDRGRYVFEAMHQLRASGFHSDSPFRIPQPIAYLDQWRALLMEDVTGVALSDLSEPEQLQGVASAGRCLAKLHRTRPKVIDRYSVDDETNLLDGWVSLVSAVHTELMSPAQQALQRVSMELDRCRQFEPALVHRDFYEKQVLMDGVDTILVDFDTLCVSDPALDVGNFLAHLELNRLQRIIEVDGADLAFLEGYGSRQSMDFHARVATYTRAALLRLACLYSFWPRWRHVCEPLLEGVNGN